MSKPTMSRAQHIIPSGIIAAVGIWVAFISYTQTPSEAFLFPRLISTVFVALALWTFIKALLGSSKTGTGITWNMMRNVAPGLIIALIYVFWAAKGLGFYTATTITFFILLSIYDPAHARDVGALCQAPQSLHAKRNLFLDRSPKRAASPKGDYQ